MKSFAPQAFESAKLHVAFIDVVGVAKTGWLTFMHGAFTYAVGLGLGLHPADRRLILASGLAAFLTAFVSGTIDIYQGHQYLKR